MKGHKIIVLFLVFLCVCITAKSQVEKETSLDKQNNTNPIYEVDFNRLNSVNIENLEFQAYVLFLQKDFEKAAKLYLKLIDYNIDDAESYYQLACCYAMLDNPEYSINFLVLAINNGYNDYSKIKEEECFKQIINSSEFENTLKEVLNYGKNYGETIYVTANVLLKCRVILPANFDPNKEYTLLTGLHGFGDLAENFCQIHDDIDSDNFIFVVPEAPYFSSNVYNKKYQFSWDIRANSAALWKKSDPEVMRYIINVIDQMNEKYKIDKNYLLGFSQGAAYAYATGIKNPDKIDAVLAFGGRFPDTEKYPWFLSEDDLEKGKEVKIFIAHGKTDKAISYKKSLEVKKKLSKLNYDIELFLFKEGHIVHKEAIPNAIKWLDSISK